MVCYLLPFFLFGWLVQTRGAMACLPGRPSAAAPVLVALPILLLMPTPSPDMDRRTFAVLWTGLWLSAWVATVCPDLKILRWLGGHA